MNTQFHAVLLLAWFLVTIGHNGSSVIVGSILFGAAATRVAHDQTAQIWSANTFQETIRTEIKRLIAIGQMFNLIISSLAASDEVAHINSFVFTYQAFRNTHCQKPLHDTRYGEDFEKNNIRLCCLI